VEWTLGAFLQKRLELSEAKKSGKDDAGDGPKVEGGGDLTYPATSLTPADPFISAASLDFIPSVLLIAVLLTVPLLLIYLKGQNKSLTELMSKVIQCDCIKVPVSPSNLPSPPATANGGKRLVPVTKNSLEK